MSCVYRSQGLDCFQFDHQLVCHQKVESSFTDVVALIGQRNFHLPGEGDTSKPKLHTECGFIHAFQKPWSKNSMYLDGCTDNAVRKSIQIPVWFGLGALGVLAVQCLVSVSSGGLCRPGVGVRFNESKFAGIVPMRIA